MLYFDDIKVNYECQGYKATHLDFSPDKTKSVLFFESTVETKDVTCPHCGGEVYVHENYQSHLIDMPLHYGITHCCELFHNALLQEDHEHHFLQFHIWQTINSP